MTQPEDKNALVAKLAGQEWAAQPHRFAASMEMRASVIATAALAIRGAFEALQDTIASAKKAQEGANATRAELGLEPVADAYDAGALAREKVRVALEAVGIPGDPAAWLRGTTS